MLSWVEHAKSFITSGPDCVYAQIHLTPRGAHMQSCRKSCVPAHLIMGHNIWYGVHSSRQALTNSIDSDQGPSHRKCYAPAQIWIIPGKVTFREHSPTISPITEPITTNASDKDRITWKDKIKYNLIKKWINEKMCKKTGLGRVNSNTVHKICTGQVGI